MTHGKFVAFALALTLAACGGGTVTKPPQRGKQHD